MLTFQHAGPRTGTGQTLSVCAQGGQTMRPRLQGNGKGAWLLAYGGGAHPQAPQVLVGLRAFVLCRALRDRGAEHQEDGAETDQPLPCTPRARRQESPVAGPW